MIRRPLRSNRPRKESSALPYTAPALCKLGLKLLPEFFTGGDLMLRRDEAPYSVANVGNHKLSLDRKRALCRQTRDTLGVPSAIGRGLFGQSGHREDRARLVANLD